MAKLLHLLGARAAGKDRTVKPFEQEDVAIVRMDAFVRKAVEWLRPPAEWGSTELPQDFRLWGHLVQCEKTVPGMAEVIRQHHPFIGEKPVIAEGEMFSFVPFLEAFAQAISQAVPGIGPEKALLLEPPLEKHLKQAGESDRYDHRTITREVIEGARSRARQGMEICRRRIECVEATDSDQAAEVIADFLGIACGGRTGVS